MTKQEKIDWGLRALLGELFGQAGDYYLYLASKEIREYLHSQDVGIINARTGYIEPLIKEE